MGLSLASTERLVAEPVRRGAGFSWPSVAHSVQSISQTEQCIAALVIILPSSETINKFTFLEKALPAGLAPVPPDPALERVFVYGRSLLARCCCRA